MTTTGVGVNPLDPAYGAIGDGIADDKAALDLAFAAAKASGAPLFFPGGKRFKCVLTEPWAWTFDGASQYGGLKIMGEGRCRSIVRLEPTYAGGPNVKAWQWQGPSDWYYVDVTDMSVEAVFDGVALTLGRENFSDPLNFFTARNLMVFNPQVGFNVEALRLNYLVNSHFDNCQANCFANGQGANYGVGVHHRQARFVVHTNPSYGNASYAVVFDGTGHNRDIEFVGGDYENGNYLWYVNGPNCGNIRVRGGQHSLWGMYGVYAPSSMSKAIVFENPTTENGSGPSAFIHPSSTSKVKIKDLWV